MTSLLHKSTRPEPNRWKHWAQRLRVGAARRMDRYREPGMAYRLSARLRTLVTSQRSLAVLRCFPQIHITFQDLRWWMRQEHVAPRTTVRVTEPMRETLRTVCLRNATPAPEPRTHAEADLRQSRTIAAEHWRMRTSVRRSEVESVLHRTTTIHARTEVAAPAKRLAAALRTPASPSRMEESTHASAMTVRTAAGPAPGKASARTRAAEPAETVYVAPWSKTAPASAMSIEHVADQVIRQIDSRMIAWRERMGRI